MTHNRMRDKAENGGGGGGCTEGREVNGTNLQQNNDAVARGSIGRLSKLRFTYKELWVCVAFGLRTAGVLGR